MKPTDDTVAPGDEVAHPLHYLIPKWIVWLVVLLVVGVLVQQCVDILRHLDWPPHDGRNLAIRNALNCNARTSHAVTAQMLRGEKSTEYSARIGVDRLAFITNADCLAAGIYLRDEGTGIRHEFGVYDMSTKRLTARIVITHEKFDHD